MRFLERLARKVVGNQKVNSRILKTIKGIEIEEKEDLRYNLKKVRKGIRERMSFGFLFNQAVEKYVKSNRIPEAGLLYKSMLFVILLPQLVSMTFRRRGIENEIIAAENELIFYFNQPITKVRRFRLKCEQAKYLYQADIDMISKETKIQEENLEARSIGERTRKEIKTLLIEFEEKKRSKTNKLVFYSKCEEKLIGIEEQIRIKQSIEESRIRIRKIEEIQAESSKQKEIEEEFILYEYYGDLLDSISTNLKRLEHDKEEEIEEEEMLKMLRSIELKN